MDIFAAAQAALLDIHAYSTSEDVEESSGPSSQGAPLDTLFEALRSAILAPDPIAPAAQGLRTALAALLYNSQTPRDLGKWLELTDHEGASKDVSSGRKKAFELLTDHLVKKKEGFEIQFTYRIPCWCVICDFLSTIFERIFTFECSRPQFISHSL